MRNNIDNFLISDKNYNYDAQFQDNLLNEEIEKTDDDFSAKRILLEKTKIVKQTWSIMEIYQKIDKGDLILDPEYQRNEVWHISKQISFIESLFMEIMIPPIYVVEIPGTDILEGKKYEVVDGKQRLSTINKFINNQLKLDKRYLEYYSDLYDGKDFRKILDEYSDKVNQVLSSILDIYVITSNSPAETKYDIFARLNKGAEPLKVNEIRKAIYHSEVTQMIDKFIKDKMGEKEKINDSYLKIFSTNDIKRFNDYGRFYRSIAFYYNTDLKLCIVKNYNSRPKQMIDDVLLSFQRKETYYVKSDIEKILNNTIALMEMLDGNPEKEYLIDACIPFSLSNWHELKANIDNIISNKDITETFKKSKATTTNVNKRVKVVSDILNGSMSIK